MSRWLDNAAGAFGTAALDTYTTLRDEKRKKEQAEREEDLHKLTMEAEERQATARAALEEFAANDRALQASPVTIDAASLPTSEKFLAGQGLNISSGGDTISARPAATGLPSPTSSVSGSGDTFTYSPAAGLPEEGAGGFGAGDISNEQRFRERRMSKVDRATELARIAGITDVNEGIRQQQVVTDLKTKELASLGASLALQGKGAYKDFYASVNDGQTLDFVDVEGGIQPVVNGKPSGRVYKDIAEFNSTYVVPNIMGDPGMAYDRLRDMQTDEQFERTQKEIVRHNKAMEGTSELRQKAEQRLSDAKASGLEAEAAYAADFKADSELLTKYVASGQADKLADLRQKMNLKYGKDLISQQPRKHYGWLDVDQSRWGVTHETLEDVNMLDNLVSNSIDMSAVDEADVIALAEVRADYATLKRNGANAEELKKANQAIIDVETEFSDKYEASNEYLVDFIDATSVYKQASAAAYAGSSRSQGSGAGDSGDFVAKGLPTPAGTSKTADQIKVEKDDRARLDFLTDGDTRQALQHLMYDAADEGIDKNTAPLLRKIVGMYGTLTELEKTNLFNTNALRGQRQFFEENLDAYRQGLGVKQVVK